MANIKSAIKRARQNTKNRAHNASRRSMLRTYIKAVLKAVAAKSVGDAKTAFLAAQKVIDNATSKGLIHKNKASRLKSRLNNKVKALATA